MSLEFLGLEEEAMQLILSCIVIGIALGAQLGAIFAYGKNTGGKVSVGQIVFLVICILAGLVALFTGAIPAILLFFTFQWKTLFGAVIQGAIAGVPAYFIARAIVLRHRRGKYMRNPVVKEAVAFCKANNIVGIQCFNRRLRFFKVIEDPGYCKRDVSHVKKESKYTATMYQESWTRPDSWVAYDSPASYAGEIVFSERGYPNVPDLPMFASALAKKLPGFDYAEHDHRVQYDTVSYSGNTKTTTHNIILLNQDCFVFSKKALRETKKEWHEKGWDKPLEEEKSVKTKAKSWE